MHRDIEKDLSEWKSQARRSPLIIRGARQVGKSHLIESFGRSHFKSTVVVDFEFQPRLKDCFQSPDPTEIINKLRLILGGAIKEGETLLFIDEIQECPAAIMSLRYFKEKMPGLAVIAAGSLIEFALRAPDFKMPVGRIQFLYMVPLSFAEYLGAVGHQKLRDFLTQVKISDSIDDAVHGKLLELLRTYLILGGMPAVVSEYLRSKDLFACQKIQTGLLQTFRGDFGRYARLSRHQDLQKVFDSVPRLAGQRIKFSNIDPDIRSRELKNALNLLIMAGIVKPVYSTKASGLPLGAQVNERRFKLNFLDVGLMQNSCGLQGQLSTDKNFIQINSGAVAEQFAGQELVAYSNRYKPCDLYFWAREKRNSMAEVDYVINIGEKVIPIEVKSGSGGRIRSLRMFIETRKPARGVRLSQGKLNYHDKILSVPLYMVGQLPRLIENI